MGTPVLRVRTVLSGWQGAPGLMTNYFAFNDSATAVVTGTAEDCVTRVHGYVNALAGIFPEAWHADVQSSVEVLDSATGVVVDELNGGTSAQITGSGTAGFGPAPTGMLVSWRTLLVVGRRRLKGRSFLSPMSLQDDSNGTPTAAQISIVQSAADTYIEPASGQPDPIVWHRPVAGAGGLYAPIVQARVPDLFAILRSRR